MYQNTGDLRKTTLKFSVNSSRSQSPNFYLTLVKNLKTRIDEKLRIQTLFLNKSFYFLFYTERKGGIN